jgi:hypothetical protein
MADGLPSIVCLEYRNGLRYPHLQRVDGTPDLLLLLLTTRQHSIPERGINRQTDVP